MRVNSSHPAECWLDDIKSESLGHFILSDYIMVYQIERYCEEFLDDFNIFLLKFGYFVRI